MKKYEEFFINVNDVVDRIVQTQGDQILKAADFVSDSL
jgi:hypothetical protein